MELIPSPSLLLSFPTSTNNVFLWRISCCCFVFARYCLLLNLSSLLLCYLLLPFVFFSVLLFCCVVLERGEQCYANSFSFNFILSVYLFCLFTHSVVLFFLQLTLNQASNQTNRLTERQNVKRNSTTTSKAFWAPGHWWCYLSTTFAAFTFSMYVVFCRRPSSLVRYTYCNDDDDHDPTSYVVQ